MEETESRMPFEVVSEIPHKGRRNWVGMEAGEGKCEDPISWEWSLAIQRRVRLGPLVIDCM